MGGRVGREARYALPLVLKQDIWWWMLCVISITGPCPFQSVDTTIWNWHFYSMIPPNLYFFFGILCFAVQSRQRLPPGVTYDLQWSERRQGFLWLPRSLWWAGPPTPSAGPRSAAAPHWCLTLSSENCTPSQRNQTRLFVWPWQVQQTGPRWGWLRRRCGQPVQPIGWRDTYLRGFRMSGVIIHLPSGYTQGSKHSTV